MKILNKKAFTLVELLIVVVIIGTLSTAAYFGIRGTSNWFKNNRVGVDLNAISNALERYKKDHNNTYPIPEPGGSMNVLCFAADATYVHDCDSATFYQGMIDNNLLTKQYLQEVPTDPRTNSRYVYGVSADGEYSQVAGVVYENGEYRAETQENIGKGFFLPSLIRAYNSPNFVVHQSTTNLPYNPDHRVISAGLADAAGEVYVCPGLNDPDITDCDSANGILAVDYTQPLFAGDVIQTYADSYVDIYFSDGSLSTLSAESKLRIQEDSEVIENDEDTTSTKVQAKLLSGKVWNKVVRLASRSEFNIETIEAVAGTKGTEFGVCVDDIDLCLGEVKVFVYSGEVWIGETYDPNSTITATPTAPHQANITPSGPQNSAPVTDQDILDYINSNYGGEVLHAGYTDIHSGMLPYITSAEEQANTDDSVIYISFNQLTVDDIYGLTQPQNGFQIFTESQISPASKEVMEGETPIQITNVSYDQTRENYYFTIDETLLGSESFVLRAFQINGSTTYTNISWPPLGLSDIQSPQETEYEYTNPEITSGLSLQAYISGPRSGVTGSAINLTATVINEKDPGDSLYFWALKNKPQNSGSQLNATDETADFTPDVEGTYVVSLLVTNDDELTNEATSIITVTQAGATYCGDGILQTPNDDQIYEECDSGTGCLPDCTCDINNGYTPNQSTDCTPAQQYYIALVDQTDIFTAGDDIHLDINSPSSEYNVYIDQTLAYSNLSYNPYTPVQAGYYKLELTDDTTQYVEFTLLTQAQAICYGADLTEGTQDDVGYYHDNGCWILGAENQNCTNACVTATLTCGAGDWNDDTSCTVCSELTGVESCAAAINQFAPHIYNEIACKYRDIPLPVDYCNILPDPDYQRICKCE